MKPSGAAIPAEAAHEMLTGEPITTQHAQPT
jgi:hypothetical protein